MIHFRSHFLLDFRYHLFHNPYLLDIYTFLFYLFDFLIFITNILYTIKINVNLDFLIDIADALANTFINEYQNCYGDSLNCLYFVILTCKKQQLNINEYKLLGI